MRTHDPQSPASREPRRGEGPTAGVLTTGEAVRWAQRLHADGKHIVFTNGVFDLLHPGHVRYLQDARRLGDALIVAVNSDRSVRANKGPTRPVNPEAERAEVLAVLGSVDAVVVFDEDTPYEIIGHIQPDVLIKGADWGPENIVGRDIVEARGGKVVRIPLAEGYSTTGLIARIKPP